jgi:uncharacterized protein involved in outer membrane biogenesis
MQLFTGHENGIPVRAPIKLLLWLFTGISTLVAVLVALLFFVDVDVYRGQIERHVSAAFGREVILAGPLSLEPSITPRFALKGLKITNPDWASRPFLASVDKFDIRVGLLPLLRGELQIVSLEFHGVDLLLEEADDGANNFTFSDSGEPAALPAIGHMLLYDAAIAYAAAGGPVRRLHMERVTARKVPGQPVELEAHTAVNAVPVTLSLSGEPQGDGEVHDPWQLTLLGEAGDLSLRVEGSLADPTDWGQGEYRLVLKGQHLDDLETLSGYALPDAGPYKLAANIRFKLDEYLAVSDFSAQFGGSELHGSLRWDMSTPRPVVKVRLESQQLDAGDLGIAEPRTGHADQANTAYWDQPFDIAIPGAIDLDAEIQVQRLDGLAKPLQDIVLSATADRQHLMLAAIKASVEDIQIAASAALPWGERLTALASEAASLKTLLQHAELDIRAQAANPSYQYATQMMGHPLHLEVSSVEATARPGAALTIRAEAALNDTPVTVKLQGEPLAALLQRPSGPWRALALEVRGENIRLDATGSVAKPFQAGGFDVSYDMSGTELDALLPLQGSFSLSGHYADHPDRHLFDHLKVMLGRSDIGGRVVVYLDEQRPRLVANLDADRIHLDDILPVNAGETRAADAWDQPLAIGGLGAVDLDLEVRVRQLEGLAKPIQDIRLDAQASGETLILAPLQGTLDDTQLDARVQLPWGERLTALGKDGVSVQGLVQQADVALKARPPDGKLRYQTTIAGQSFDLGLTGFEAGAGPGEGLQVNASAILADIAVQVTLQAEPLAHLLQRPTGPWRHLTAEVQGGDIRFQASGSVDRPFEARGFDMDYKLSGASIDRLLPLFDLVLPLEGAFSLSGHLADLPDRFVFDELKIRAGNSDIGGRISIYQGPLRPRVVANLKSEQIYLSKLLPVSEAETAAGAERRVIPDYTLPIERMREIDGELTFSGKRLRTTVGDLGDISFTATLKDAVFRMEPFQVRGWAGALIESDGLIDASRDPPIVEWNWIARQLSHGVLLKEAGFAETVDGTLDITLRLTGSGRSRRELLGDARGQLIVVGQEGRFGSRRLDLWGSDLVTTMLSREWHSEDVTDLNCLVARIGIEDGVASSDDLLVDTRRITIAAAGTLDLESEELDLVFAPRPKRTSLVSLTSPVRVTGTLAAPEVETAVLPRRRMAAAGTGMLAGLVNPGYLLFTFTQTGSRQANPCAAAVEAAMVMKGTRDETDNIPSEAPARFSLLPGCTRSRQRPTQR